MADAHLGRLIRVDLRGRISELVAFASTDSVPTGLEVADGKVFVATAGPIPHLPSDSAINAVRRDGSTKVVGTWAADYAGDRGLIVDVEQGRHHRLYGLLQGHWDLEPLPENEGKPAAPNTGEIVAVGADGTFTTVVSGLNHKRRRSSARMFPSHYCRRLQSSPRSRYGRASYGYWTRSSSTRLSSSPTWSTPLNTR